MNLYKSFLKLLVILLLIPLGLSIVAMLGFVGFGLDFKNAWEHPNSSGPSSMYMLLLPLGFVVGVGWIIYVWSKHRAATRAKDQETKIRQQVYNEQALGRNIYDIIVNMLAREGDMTTEELSQALNVDQDEIMLVLKDLIQAGRIGQDVSQHPARFHVVL